MIRFIAGSELRLAPAEHAGRAAVPSRLRDVPLSGLALAGAELIQVHAVLGQRGLELLEQVFRQMGVGAELAQPLDDRPLRRDVPLSICDMPADLGHLLGGVHASV